MSKKKASYFFFALLIGTLFILPIGVSLLFAIKPGSINEIGISDFSPLYLDKIKIGEGLKGKVKGTLMDAAINLRLIYDNPKSNFALKDELMECFQIIKEQVFFVDPFPDKVIQGKNGWLFLGNDFNQAIKESIGLRVLNDTEIDELTSFLQNNARWFAKQGIVYYFVLIPGKHSMYKEFLPFHNMPTPTNYDLLVENLSKKQIPFIDIRQSLLPAKSIELYYKEDTHWNGYGAFLGYTLLMDSIAYHFPAVHVLKEEDVKFNTVYNGRMDLSDMLNRDTKFPHIVLNTKNRAAQRIESELDISKKPGCLAPDKYEFRFRKNEDSLKVMIFRDSFYTGIMSAFSECFGESVFVWDYFFDTTIIKQECPNIVIQEVSERAIDDFYYENKSQIKK